MGWVWPEGAEHDRLEGVVLKLVFKESKNFSFLIMQAHNTAFLVQDKDV